MSTIILPGIDKIWLQTNDFEVKDSRVFRNTIRLLEGQTIDDLPPLFRDKKGSDFKGSSGLYKGQVFDYVVAVNNKGLSLQFNPSKILHQYQLNSDVHSIAEIEKQIEHELNAIGICFDHSKTKPTRLDFAKQDFMPRSLENYYPVFAALQGKRMKGQVYETGYTFANSMHEFCFYSKGHEMKIQSLEDLLRAENRLLKPEVIRKSLGYASLSDFLKSDANEWNAHYVSYLNSTIFRQSKQGFLFDFDTEVERLKMFKATGRNAVFNYLVNLYLQNHFQMYGNLEFLFKVMEGAGFSRKQIHKERKRMRELLSVPGNSEIVSIGTLIDELKQKFAA